MTTLFLFSFNYSVLTLSVSFTGSSSSMLHLKSQSWDFSLLSGWLLLSGWSHWVLWPKKHHDYFLVSNQIAYEDQISLISCLYSQLCVLQLHLHIAEASQLNIYTTLIFIFPQTCLFSVFNMSLSVQPVAKSQSKTNPPPVWNSLDFFLSFIPPPTTHKIRKMYWF